MQRKAVLVTNTPLPTLLHKAQHYIHQTHGYKKPIEKISDSVCLPVKHLFCFGRSIRNKATAVYPEIAVMDRAFIVVFFV
jgi:hypothetical protein